MCFFCFTPPCPILVALPPPRFTGKDAQDPSGESGEARAARAPAPRPQIRFFNSRPVRQNRFFRRERPGKQATATRFQILLNGAQPRLPDTSARGGGSDPGISNKGTPDSSGGGAIKLKFNHFPPPLEDKDIYMAALSPTFGDNQDGISRLFWTLNVINK